MHDSEEALRREIFETKQNANETWIHVRCSKMLDALGELKIQHKRELEAARAEGYAQAKEQAAGEMDRMAETYMYGSRGRAVAEDGASIIRAMQLDTK